jgi:hypothetical protein
VRSVTSPLGSEVLGVRRSVKRFWSRLMVGQALPRVLKVVVNNGSDGQ